MSSNEHLPYEKCIEISEVLLSMTSIRPTVGLVTGSGLGYLSDLMQVETVINYSDIPHFATCSVQGHTGSLIFGQVEGIPFVCAKGRVHPYEGISEARCSLPIRIMKLLGIRILLLTNASGGLRHGLHSGDILMIRDHVSLSDMTGRSALWGPNDERWGPRFPAIHNIYDKELRGLIRQASEKLGLGSRLSEGIYCYSPGPSYNTAVEVRFMRDCLRTDVVGMSTAYEAVTAVHCGLRVACLSLVTEVCLADENDEESVSHEAVLAASQASADHMKSLVSLFIQSTNESA